MPTRPQLGRLTVAAIALVALVPAAPADARVLKHRPTHFSVQAPSGSKLSFDVRTGAYTVANRRGRMTYQRVRTGASPARAGRYLLRRAQVRALGVRRARGIWAARLPAGRTLVVRNAGRRKLRVLLWRPAGRRDGAAARLSYRRIAAHPRGGRAHRLRRSARLLARVAGPRVRLTWETPVEGATISGSRVELEVEASRPSAVESVRFLSGGRVIETQFETPYEATMDATELRSGPHRLRAVARLRSGRTVSARRTVRVAGSPGTSPGAGPSLPIGDGNPFFLAGFEGGLSPFRTIQAESDDRIRAVGSPGAFAGGQSARFEVRPGDEAAGGNRAEVTGPSFDEGQAVFFRQAIRVAASSTLEDRWQQVVQYSTNGEGSPALALFLVGPEDGGRFRFELRRGDSSETYWRSPVLARDTWHDVAVRVRFSSSSNGSVGVYLGGRPQTLTNGSQTASATTIEFGRAYYKTGVYRSSSHTGTSVVFHDHIQMGRTAADIGL
jgi:hypothetical protein